MFFSSLSYVRSTALRRALFFGRSPTLHSCSRKWRFTFPLENVTKCVLGVAYRVVVFAEVADDVGSDDESVASGIAARLLVAFVCILVAQDYLWRYSLFVVWQKRDF